MIFCVSVLFLHLASINVFIFCMHEFNSLLFLSFFFEEKFHVAHELAG